MYLIQNFSRMRPGSLLMSRALIRAITVMVLGVAVCGAVGAIEATLLDFARLAPDTPFDSPEDNAATLVGFGDIFNSSVGLSLSPQESEGLQFSLAIPKWQIEFNSSARRPPNIRTSDVRTAVVKDTSAQFAGSAVLGVRLVFPEGNVNASALIKPPYTIPRVDTVVLRDGSELDYDGVGRLRNVGTIRAISIDAYGLNYPHKVSVLLEEQDGVVREYIVGHLQFEGWKTITVENPKYVQVSGVQPEPGADDAAVVPAEEGAVAEDDAAVVPAEEGAVAEDDAAVVPAEEGAVAEDDAAVVPAEEGAVAEDSAPERSVVRAPPEPLYPFNAPVVALRGIRIHKNAQHPSPDFIGYFKEIRLDYDERRTGLVDDIDNEDVWHILRDEQDVRKKQDYIRNGSSVLYEALQAERRYQGEE